VKVEFFSSFSPLSAFKNYFHALVFRQEIALFKLPFLLKAISAAQLSVEASDSGVMQLARHG
jgi:hypothetical protein